MSNKVENEHYQPSVYEVLRTDLLKCPVCNDMLVNPVILPCLDTMCWDCLEREFQMTDSGLTDSKPPSFKCPVCRNDVDIPKDGIAAFKTNSFMINMLDVLSCQSEETKPCEYCNFDHKAEVATHRCLDCQDDMCNDCASAHRRTKLTRGHKLAPFELIQMGRYDDDIRRAQNVQCDDHGENVYTELCKECNSLICQECKASKHAGHNVLPLAEEGDKASKQIKILQTSTTSKLPGLEAYDVYMTSYSGQLVDIQANLVAGVENQAALLHNLVDKQKESALKEITSSIDREREHVETKRAKLNGALTSIKCGGMFLDNLLTYGKNDEILHLQKLIIDRLSSLVYMKLDGLSHKLGLFFKTGTVTDANMGVMFGHVEQCQLPVGKADMASFSATDLAMTNVLPDISNKAEIVVSFDTKSTYDDKDVWPTGLAISPEGHTAIVDRENRRVKFFSEKGEFKYDFGAKGKHALGCPFDMAFLLNGNIVVTDYLDEDLKVFTSNGQFVMSVRNHFKHPRGVAVNSAGNIVVVDCGYRRLTVHNPTTGALLQAIGGVDDDDNAIFTDPYYVTIGRNDCMIVTDWAAPNIKVFNSKGEYVAKHGNYGIRQDEVLQPYGVCTDAFGYMFIADHQNHRIHLLLPDGRFQKFLATTRDGLWHPMAIDINSQGHLVVTESLGNVKVFKYM